MNNLKIAYLLKKLKKRGYTLLEIIVVLVILSILAVISVPKFVDISDNAKTKAFEAAASELNSRENLVWLNIKNSDGGWIDDETLFTRIDDDIGVGYYWESKAGPDGGQLYFKNEMVKLDRTPSTAVSPGRWEIDAQKEKKKKKKKKKKNK
jgi:prepilin-type N-terminal cleavage/methylation domain-containing protein